MEPCKNHAQKTHIRLKIRKYAKQYAKKYADAFKNTHFWHVVRSAHEALQKIRKYA